MTLVAEQIRCIVRQGLKALPLVLALLLPACDRPPVIHSFSGSTMGTTWSVKTVGLPPGVADASLRSDIALLLESVNNQMSTWQPDSAISRYNQAEAGEWLTLPPDFFRVLDYARHLASETDGAYDPTVGPLVNLWGFGPGRDEFIRPEPEAIERARQRTGWQRLELTPENRGARQPGELYLDLSSVAKGFAVDKVAEFLSARGLEAYLVEIGGELRASGRKPGGTPWRIAIEQPDVGARRVGQVIALDNAAVATSGDYRNFYKVDGELLSHTIDPRTGRPVDHGLALVSVLHDSCMEADALATALLVMGPERGLAFARQRELAARFIVRDNDGVSETLTPAFERHVLETATP